MEVRNIKVGYLETNCYILSNNKECIIIDPGDQFYSIDEQIKDNKLIGVLITHRHPDHIGALEKLINTYHVNVYDKSNLKEQEYSLGSFVFDVIYTPGHTSDSVSYYFKDYNFMFTGDFLFKNSIGRTDMPTGNTLEMKQSIAKIKEYSSRIKIYPGHGEITNLGIEKDNNPFLR